MHLLLIDSRNLYSIARFAQFRTEESLPQDLQGVAELFANRVWSLISAIQPTSIIFCLDKKPYDRTAYYPGYKIRRKEDGPRGKEAFRLVEDRILATGAVAQVLGYEGEDLITQYCKRLGGRDGIVVTWCSSDRDLLQLSEIWPNVRGWNPYSWGPVEKPFPNWLEYRALSGDDSDCIPGVTSEDRAKALLIGPPPDREPKTLETLLAKDYKPKAVDLYTIEQGRWTLDQVPKTNRDVFERNKKLMALLGPYCLMDPCPIAPPPRNQSFDELLSILMGKPFVGPEEQCSAVLAEAPVGWDPEYMNQGQEEVTPPVAAPNPFGPSFVPAQYNPPTPAQYGPGVQTWNGEEVPDAPDTSGGEWLFTGQVSFAPLPDTKRGMPPDWDERTK